MSSLQECLNRVATRTLCADAATLRTLAWPVSFDPAMSKAALQASVEALSDSS
jgi:hypothetical protein